MPIYTLLTAVAITLSYLVLTYYMLDLAGHPEMARDAGAIDKLRWDRTISVYNGIQTLAFAAAGVLLGTTVQASRVSDAKEIANANVADADKAKAARAIVNVPPPGGTDVHPTVAALRQVLA